MEVGAEQLSLSNLVRRVELSENPVYRFLCNACAVGVKRFHPYFLKLTYHNNHSSLEEEEGGTCGFFVLFCNGLH